MSDKYNAAFDELKKHQRQLDHEGMEVGVSRQALDEMLEGYEAAVTKLNINKCNAGHETLPLYLWDCPRCHEETKKENERLREQTSRLKSLCWFYLENIDNEYSGTEG